LSSYTKAHTQRQCDEQGVGHSTPLSRTQKRRMDIADPFTRRGNYSVPEVGSV